MTHFDRAGHYRTNQCGTTFWVRPHDVSRDDWDKRGTFPQAYQDALQARSALAFLRLSNASHGSSACYVNPNARCPVCDAPVFFYANSSGSRVFFDHLGPPWSKHPCTDNGASVSKSGASTFGPITTRAKGQREELVEAANAALLMKGKVFGSRTPHEWTIAVVDSIIRDGEKNTIRAEFLDSNSHEKTVFECISTNWIFDVGDLIHIRGSLISFFDRASMTAIEFPRGGRVPVVGNAPAHIDKVGGEASRQREYARIRLVVPGRKQKLSKAEMRPDEMERFRSNRISMDQFCESLAPLIKAYASQGIRKPAQVSKRLNKEHHRTADSGVWTPRLARFLLANIFSKRSNTRR